MPTQILFVDDEPQLQRLIRQRFRSELREGTYHFLFAENGQEALDMIAQHPEIDMVLTDINMPVMDGLTFLSRLRASGSLLKTIVVSAYGDMSNIRKAMNMGAFDFLTKPIDFVDLKTTIEKTIQENLLLRQAQQAKQLAEKNKQLEELDEIKSHFFTNISHELRTPLTVITGIAQQLQENPERLKEDSIETIRRNSDRLLELINQILDLRKLESGKMSLHLVQSDITKLCNYITNSFRFLAEQKGVQLHYLSDEDQLLMDYDPEKFSRILTNLISNAIKHTDKGGHIYLMLSRQNKLLKIKVKDTGCGIPADQIPFIFNRFFQAKGKATGGTGIGLSLVKELVALMEGAISVDSEWKKGSIFSLTLPINNNAPIIEENDHNNIERSIQLHTSSQVKPPIELQDNFDENLPELLIVEDNQDILTYLTSCLKDQYRIVSASNGEAGLEKALEVIPDIIISDVMMPRKDGFELCETLKQDQRTSHIPIVLLTAKAGVENRIRGLSRGADAYLSKPFNEEELDATLQQLLKQRTLLRERYANLEEGVEKDQSKSDYDFAPEDDFIKKAIALIEENINDTQFTVPVFCRQMGMSYPVIHRKLAALVGKSPALFIRAIRLYQAKKLLRQPEKNITEIAYEVGFTDPKYFSRAFSEEFKAPPSTFRG